MLRVAAMVVVSSLLAAAAGCSATENAPVECHSGRSSLSSISPRTGKVSWVARLTQTSEQPPRVEGGNVVVTAPCGAVVADLAGGGVRYDGKTPGSLVGVAGNQLFTLDEPAGQSIPITGIDLGTSRPGGGYRTNTPYQAATVADGSLVVLYGGQLEAVDETGSGPSWSIQLPVGRRPRLLRSGHLLLLTTDDGSTYAVDLADGTLEWRSIPPVAARFYDLQLTAVPDTVLTVASPYDEERKPFGYATDATTGRLRWTRAAVSVLAADRDLTVLRTATAVVAVDTVSGALRWRRAAPRIDVPADVPRAALTSDTVVVPQPGSPALGLDRGTGRVRWRGPVASAATAAGDVVVTSTYDRVTALDAHTGAARWTRTARRDRIELAVAPDGQVLLLDSDLVPHLGA